MAGGNMLESDGGMFIIMFAEHGFGYPSENEKSR